MISTFKKFNKIPKKNKFGELNMMEGILHVRCHLNKDLQYRSRVSTAPNFYQDINELSITDRCIFYSMAQLMGWDNTLQISILELSRELKITRSTVNNSINSLLNKLCFLQLIKKHHYIISPIYFTKGNSENIISAITLWDMALQNIFDEQEEEYKKISKKNPVPEGMPFLVF